MSLLSSASPDDARMKIALSRWAFLEKPWYRRWLKNITCGWNAQSAGTGRYLYLSLQREVGAEQERKMQQLREATELCGLMMRVDAGARWFLCEKYPNLIAHLNLDIEAPEMRIALTTHTHSLQSGSLWILLKPLLGEQPQDPAFLDARARIVAADTSGRLRKWTLPLSLEFIVPATFPPGNSPKQRIDEIVEVVEELTARSRGHNTYPFRLESITVGIMSLNRREATRSLMTLLTLGAPVELWIPDRCLGGRLQLPSQTLHILSTAAPCDPIHTLGVFPHNLAESAVYFSMVRCSSLFRCVNVYESAAFNKESTYLRWLIATFFMENNSVETLELRGFALETTDLERIQSMLQSENPLGYLIVEDPSQRSQNTKQTIRLGKSTSIQIQGQQHWETAESLQIVTENTLYAACEWDDDHLAVLVPGFGICRVRKDDVKSLANSDPRFLEVWQEPTASQRRITTLSLCLTEQSATQIPRFLELVGTHLCVLSLSGREFSGYALAQCCRACPCLERLSVTAVMITSQRALFRSGACSRLRSLSVTDARLDRRSLLGFIRELADPSSRASQTLEVFEWLVSPFWSVCKIPNELVIALLHMLRVNRRVSMLAFPMSSISLQELLLGHNGEWTTADDVSIRGRIALLSVVQRSVAAERSSSIARLDALCLANIFRFVGGRRRRCVVVNTCVGSPLSDV